MSSEPVSDEDLTRLIESTFIVRERKLLSLLTELKSLRAQQAEPPAIQSSLARMSGQPTVGPHRYPLAQMLEEICEGCTINQISSEYQIPLESIKAALRQISRNVAELPAGCAEMAKAVRVAINEHLDKHPMNGEVSFAGHEDELIEEAVAAKLAPLFTLLAECRPIVQEKHERSISAMEDFEMRHGGPFHSPRSFPSYLLLKRIDAALGKGDADGGQLSQPNESEVQR